MYIVKVRVGDAHQPLLHCFNVAGSLETDTVLAGSAPRPLKCEQQKDWGIMSSVNHGALVPCTSPDCPSWRNEIEARKEKRSAQGQRQVMTRLASLHLGGHLR